jgi:hypothetical protein
MSGELGRPPGSRARSPRQQRPCSPKKTQAIPAQGLVAGSHDRGLTSRTFDTWEGRTDESRMRGNIMIREERSLVIKDEYFRLLVFGRRYWPCAFKRSGARVSCERTVRSVLMWSYPCSW